LDEYLAEHNVGDLVTARVVAIDGSTGVARVEFGDRVFGLCPPASAQKVGAAQGIGAGSTGDISSIGSMLMARWKGNAQAISDKPDSLQPGQIRQFRITQLDRDSKQLEVISV